MPLLALACHEDIEVVERACSDGDFDACDTVVARYQLGVGVEHHREHAATVRARTLSRRMTACAKSSDGDGACSDLPEELRGLAKKGMLPREDAITRVASIELLEDGTLRLDGETIDAAELEARAKKDCAEPVRFVVRAAKEVDHGRVVAVVDALRGGGCKQISLGNRPLAAPP